MDETRKAMRRRFVEDFPWTTVFRGKGIDVGCGSDKLDLEECQPFDKQHGDANFLSRHFAYDTFDYLHSSQSLEHMANPTNALRDWLRVVKTGGYVVITVPDWCLYEGMQWPSRFNPDHKSSWSLWCKGSPAPIHIHIPTWLPLFQSTKVLKCDLIDTNYNYKIGPWKDQTLGNAEAFIEIVLEKI